MRVGRDDTVNMLLDDNDVDETNSNDILDNVEDEEDEEDAAESDDEAKHEVEGVETFICTSCD